MSLLLDVVTGVVFVAYNKTSAVLNRLRANPKPSSTSFGDFIVPNHSGDLSAGNALKTPVNDSDIVNKKYVDDNIVTPGGSNTQLQYNDNGSFSGIPTITYDDSDSTLINTGYSKIDAGFDLNPVLNPSSGSVDLAGLGSGNVDNGVHWYFVCFISDLGESGIYRINSVNVTDKSVNGQVRVTIPVSSDSRVTGRQIFRSESGGNNYFARDLVTINNNVDTEYIDNIPDSSLNTSENFYWRENTTSRQMTVNGLPSVFIGRGREPSTLVGNNAGRDLTTGQKNNGFGFLALYRCTTGGSNQAFGWGSSVSLTSGSRNCAYGHDTLYRNQTGSDNVCIGYYAGFGVTGNSYSRNVFIGRDSGKNCSTGGNNVCVGYQSGLVLSSGAYNTFIGYEVAKTFLTGNNNICLGYQAYPSSNTVSNECTIGNSDLNKFRIPGLGFEIEDDNIIIGSSKTPSSASDTGTAGMICWDSNYIYVCTATDTWKRCAINTW